MHDSAWGRKSGKKVVDTAFQPTRTPNGSTEMAMEELGNLQGIDEKFEATVKRALTPFKENIIPESDTREETIMKFRTLLVAIYLFSNFLVCIIVMNDSFQQLWWLGDTYWHKIRFFRIWMWGNSGLLILQFVGCVYQRLLNLGRLCFSRR